MYTREPVWTLLHQLTQALELDHRIILSITSRGHYNALDFTYKTDITSDDPLDIADWLFWLKDEFPGT